MKVILYYSKDFELSFKLIKKLKKKFKNGFQLKLFT